MKKLVGYITSAYPDKNFTIDLILAMKEKGLDSVELGVPFSDPVADGPIIEEANVRALSNGFRFQDLLDITNAVAGSIDTLWMGYFNPFYHRGMQKSIEEAKELGVSGFIIPDLPYEEALAYRSLFDENEIALIDFVAPTDSKERIKTILKDSKKFIYLVAYAGITGAQKSEDLSQIITWIRETTDTPVYLGFGVNEKTAKEKAKDVDGVIVGSAFVKVLLDENLTNSEKIARIAELSGKIKEQINS
ncbi:MULTISPECIES: tryptophan synthase subunit alpha [unclassified Nitratiruptor]|uniref:tryptophan synthase subunit alpha n=1 Tax=unclassified Nitratiruptor TaxID=2624044 RepID=UPI0019156D50|nr:MULTISPECIES: tryptophan synthase subunit alpha [unclassified Nitratiruptor]BCD59706.1 tryptophan synthase alpha chain [Nitratiruptor sp. YY08-10]BCD63630.1 tryptophan synthase alpha chain [Nitratiruptor sp. YY08-14]